jgi:large subunit ribosomal protein L5
MSQLKDYYHKEVVPKLRETFKYTNIMQVPKIEKIVLNMGLGEAIQNIKLLDAAVEELKIISGQQPVVTRARKSIAAFKLREGMPIGCMVTLRRKRMYDFYYKLVNIALPRVRDFRGLSPKAMDGHGNYSLGIKEQLIFPEIDYDKIDRIQGLNISIVTTRAANC